MAVAVKEKNTKYLKLREALRHFIASHPAGTCLPSYAEMIRTYGVHQSVIDKALREFDEEKLIVREHGRGMFVSPRAAQRTIGIVFGRNVFDAGVSPVNQLMLRYAEKRSCIHTENASFFINIPQVPVEPYGIRVCRDLLDAMESSRFDGVLLMTTRGKHESEWLASYGAPLVIGTNLSHLTCNAVGISMEHQEAVARLGTEALVRQGCKRIGMISMAGHQRDQGFFDDINAFRSVLESHHLEFCPELFWDRNPKPPEDSSSQPVSNEMIGYQAASDLLANGLDFDGLVCTDDMAMRGFLARMRELELKPGRDLKIATHVNRDVPVLLGYENCLTMIEVNTDEYVNQAFSLLDRLMAGEKITPGSVVKVEHCVRELPCKTEIRQQRPAKAITLKTLAMATIN